MKIILKLGVGKVKSLKRWSAALKREFEKPLSEQIGELKSFITIASVIVGFVIILPYPSLMKVSIGLRLARHLIFA